MAAEGMSTLEEGIRHLRSHELGDYHIEKFKRKASATVTLLQQQKEAVQQKQGNTTLPTTNPTKTNIPNNNTTSSPSNKAPTSDYLKDGTTITFREGKGDQRWHQVGVCTGCKVAIPSGQVRFFNGKQQFHTKCGKCPRCKTNLAKEEVDLVYQAVFCTKCGGKVRLLNNM